MNEKLSGVKTTVDKVDSVVDSVRSLVEREILVGIPASTAGRAVEPGDEPIDNATIGYLMEFGSPAANIPERPFLVPGVRSAEDAIAKRLKSAAEAALKVQPAAVDIQMNAAGLIAQNAVRQKITDGPFVPLAPRTLAERKSRGRTGIKPLIDTGQLRRSVTYVIRDSDDASS